MAADLSTPDGIADYVAARDAALLSMDGPTIAAFLGKHGLSIDPLASTFWISVHKSRTAAKTLPMEARSLSKRWLLDRGLTAWDDGDVP